MIINTKKSNYKNVEIFIKEIDLNIKENIIFVDFSDYWVCGYINIKDFEPQEKKIIKEEFGKIETITFSENILEKNIFGEFIGFDTNYFYNKKEEKTVNYVENQLKKIIDNSLERIKNER